MQSLISFFTNHTTNISKEEYEHIIMIRKLKEYKIKCEAEIKEKYSKDNNEMMECVRNNDLNGVIKIHKRDNITIPMPMLELHISDKNRDKYHYKYKEPFIEACKLGYSDIVKYFYDNNFRVNIIQHLVYHTHKGLQSRNELPENYVCNDVLHIGKNNPELLVYLKNKKNENENIFRNHHQIDEELY
jgi:hypothetical protein